MPPRYLYDLERFRNAEPIFSLEEIRKVNPQRHSMEQLTAILHIDRDNHGIVGYKDVLGDDWWAADHIPGRPLFPGVMMIEAVAQLCSYDFMLNHPSDDPDRFIGFGGVNETRFRGTVEPDGRLYLIGKAHRLRMKMFTYLAQAVYNGKLVMETQILGVAI